MQVFGRGHQVNRNGVTVYVTRCQATDVFPRTHTNCTNEIPAILNGTNVFADQLCDQNEAGAGEMQQHRTAKMEAEWAVVLHIPGDQ